MLQRNAYLECEEQLIERNMMNRNSQTSRTITSFFLPRNTVKTININSKTTSRQMIVTLLRKFRVADNPRKFALYECVHQADETTCTLLRKMTRISDDVCPLKVVLGWKNPHCGNALVLQENDTGDILWDAFEIPELENFLRILKMEEQQYVWQTKQRYSQYRYNIDDELRRRGHYVGDESGKPPQEFAPSAPSRDGGEYGTSDSMVISDVFATMKPSNPHPQQFHDPEYVNLEFLQNRQMDHSTNL
ncbi:unnamed protein product [Caenorhabditis auriculariae]|uniref:Ras-associating domain-containing protein n=1 Tax=Caenorhabditis auriculariae TaxID=2777116 RepID=A0A8S1I0E6_9PELO|nr:unnamed protein product [Caenorhabditis auriculariae]